MLTNSEVYQSAKSLIEKYGVNGAIDHCDGRILALAQEGYAEAADTWKGVRIIVQQGLCTPPVELRIS
jgi:hypothetical protein